MGCREPQIIWPKLIQEAFIDPFTLGPEKVQKILENNQIQFFAKLSQAQAPALPAGWLR